MPNVRRLLLDDCCYHLITRGNQQQKVFREKDDYQKYLKLLVKFKKKYSFSLFAYCLMPNHTHLLGEIKNNTDLSRFMHDLNRTYTLYFNGKYEICGHLWQGRFRSKVVCKDKYLIDCLNYIELNPVRANLIQDPLQYDWSSYKIRVTGEGNDILDGLPAIY